MATAPKKSGEHSASSVKRAILFELENTAINGREIIYGVVKKIVEDRGLDFNEVTFSRYCLNSPLKHAVTDLLSVGGKGQPSNAKVVDALVAGLGQAFSDHSGNVLTGMKALLDTAANEGIALGALSRLPADQARALAEQVGLLAAGGDVLSASDDDRLGPTADAWLKLSKHIGVMPSLSVVLTTSSTSCKAALSAGMRCVVVPDRFTNFQDFSGASAVFDELDADVIPEVLAVIEKP